MLLNLPRDMQKEITSYLSKEEKMILAKTNDNMRDAIIEDLGMVVYNDYKRSMLKEIILPKKISVERFNALQNVLVRNVDDIDERQSILIEKYISREINEVERKELHDDLENMKISLMVDAKELYEEFVEDFCRCYSFRELVGVYHLPIHYYITFINTVSKKRREECLLKNIYIFDNTFRFQVESTRHNRLQELINEDIGRHLMEMIYSR